MNLMSTVAQRLSPENTVVKHHSGFTQKHWRRPKTRNTIQHHRGTGTHSPEGRGGGDYWTRWRKNEKQVENIRVIQRKTKGGHPTSRSRKNHHKGRGMIGETKTRGLGSQFLYLSPDEQRPGSPGETELDHK